MFPLPLELNLKIFKLASFYYKIEWLEKNLKMPELIPAYSSHNHRFIMSGFIQNKYYSIYFLDSGYEIDSRDHNYYLDWDCNLYIFENEFGDPRCRECELFVCDHHK